MSNSLHVLFGVINQLLCRLNHQVLRQYGRELSVQDLDDLANTAKSLFANPRRDSLPTSPVAIHSQRYDAELNGFLGADENKDHTSGGPNGISSSGDDDDTSAASSTPPMATPICTKEQFTLMMLLKLGKVREFMKVGCSELGKA